MSKRKHRAVKMFMADFETTTDPNDCRVWAWGLSDFAGTETKGSDADVEVGTTIDEFMYRIDADNAVIYFHNLRFDGHFIINWLLLNDFVHVTSRDIAPMSFKTLISDTGKFYSITFKYESGVKIELRDSFKKLPMSVAHIARSFGMEEGKGEIDYDAPRPVNYNITEEERDYIVRDIRIPKTALIQQIGTGAKRLTIGSDALNEFKTLFGKKEFMRIFPEFTHEMDAEMRRAYRGGFTYAAPKFAREIVGAGQVYDVNSLYPSVMYKCAMPYGIPQWFDAEPETNGNYPLALFTVTFTARLKKDHIPCIQVKGSSQFVPTEYVSVIREPVTLTVTDVDWKLYNDHYHIKVHEWLGGWRFQQISGVFDAYIDKWMKIKAENDGGAREIAKLFLNSLYGKFATNPNVTGKIPYLKDDGSVGFRRGRPEERKPVYTPVGVFITAYARDYTIRAAQAHYHNFAYADTDSLHLITTETPSDLHIHPSELGAWKHEYDFENALYMRAKAYLERHSRTCGCKKCASGDHPVYSNAIAGLPTKISETLTLDAVYPGMEISGKLVPKSVPGGVVLTSTPFELVY